MKLHYSKILLFVLPLNILLTLYHVHNKNKPYITQHTPTTTSRLLCECELYAPRNYDNDPEMKSVKENFDRQTSERFEEYDERMKDKRQKRKEERDKNIQGIIEKDKMDKSLAEKVEKVCLRCGCGLGGVAASVGIFGAIAVNEVKKAALVVAAQKGIKVGIAKAIDELGKIYVLSEFKLINWDAMVTATTYDKPMELVEIVRKAFYECIDSNAGSDYLFCQATKAMDVQPKVSALHVISTQAAEAAGAARKAAQTVEETHISLANAESAHLYSAIGYSVLAILIILLVMVIIYLVLRYRRKKKMNKKEQYTKLLNK
ncbi:surface antigen [Plasmodium falciparum UGT5.1]|uniref:Surface antigen n=1 Tax=Plasmodium falciparum UGT5.1 TaxID=1237627 RepID=W7J9C5_PLAFA|nr:surface antigen [Plasmodium falciparum UGT5.1]